LEAIVAINFDRPFAFNEMQAARASHSSSLSLDLPKLEERQQVTLYVGQEFPQGMPPPLPFFMAAYQRDGTLEARLMVGPQFLAANFLVYTHWRDHWRKAASWFREVGEAILKVQGLSGGRPLSITGCAHQITDVFPWDGAASNIAANLILTGDISRLPSAGVGAVGSAWSGAHIGTFVSEQDPAISRQITDRLACELAQDPMLGWRLRLDHLQEVTLHHPLALDSSNAENHAEIGSVIDDLHGRNRSLLCSMLSPSMLAMIGLGAH
jgi:hypothetical protein